MATEIRANNILSDEEDESDDGSKIVELKGYLNKWTNYIHGWQRRFFVFSNGTLSYYKSELEAGHGCRGTISLRRATIKPHEFDECRFDVSVNDNVWYLRADTPEEKQHFVDLLELCKLESGYSSESNLRRYGSGLSLASNNLSASSINNLFKDKELKEKVAELCTYKDILCKQIDDLQNFYENQLGANNFDPSQVKQFDVKGEALTFKATTEAVLDRLQNCIDVMGQRDDLWYRKVEHEKEKRRKLEEMVRTLRTQIASPPDLEEGPHSTLADDEFYDAFETELDKMEEEAQNRQAFKQQLSVVLSENSNNNVTHVVNDEKTASSAEYHRLWPEIERVTKEQIKYAQMGLGNDAWHLFAEEGEMKMYRREEEVNGLVVDPLKACHVVKGVTAHEMCHYFFSPQYRYDWETTLEHMTVVENISDDTLIFLQLHKRIWPATQRDALFWSHIRQVPPNEPGVRDIWIVVNNSTELPKHPPDNKKCIRLFLTVCLLCQTIVSSPKEGASITRDNLTCKITYCSVVNPGGWAPASVLRAVYKREYPKFLKRFTAYVIDQCKNKPIMF
ncbi:ceramide transfer protein [Bemisia tabaci]|uniref:ceramide transfer protein n=1 Tax=Bemisia tabaci TaxID=7038 RepID=UPI0008F9DF39|nr:PREDICTED: collagen type IV alpha-3-binding protein [Bemisia tabaci]